MSAPRTRLGGERLLGGELSAGTAQGTVDRFDCAGELRRDQPLGLATEQQPGRGPFPAFAAQCLSNKTANALRTARLLGAPVVVLRGAKQRVFVKRGSAASGKRAGHARG